MIPHFADVVIPKTQVVLMNSTGTPLQGRVEFLDPAGVPTFVKNGVDYVHTLPYSVAPHGAQTFEISEALLSAASGSLRIVPNDNNPAPVALGILSYKPGPITISEASVPVTMGTSLQIYTERSNSPYITTEISIVNATSQTGTVTLTLADLEGHILGVASQSLTPWGQARHPIDTWIPTIRGRDIKGIVHITTTLSRIAAVGLRERHNEREPAPDFLFTTIAPISVEIPSASREWVFPQLLNGNGFSTEIVLYGGTDGIRGNLIFNRPDGTPFNPGIR